ncbi:UNVERIFIED_CONTAM: hypothetical protein RKD43_003631 [Streptomyces graminofaciens]
MQDPALEDLPGTGVGVPADEEDRQVGTAELRPVGDLAPVELADGVEGEVLQRDAVVDDEREDGDGDPGLTELRIAARLGAVGECDHRR